MKHSFLTTKILSRAKNFLTLRRFSYTGSFDDVTRISALEKKTSNFIRHVTSIIDGNKSDQMRSLSLNDVHTLLDEWYTLILKTKSVSIGGGHMGIAAAEKAEALLTALENNYDSMHASTITGNVSKKTALSLTPDQATYNLVCRVYAACDGGKDAAIRAESVLGRMIQRTLNHDHIRTQIAGEPKAKPVPPRPNIITFNTVLNAWAKSPNCGYECEQSFRNLERYSYKYDRIITSHHDASDIPTLNSRVVPNVRSLSAVVEAWTNSNTDFASERAVAILETVLEKWSQNPTGIQPNNFLIHQVLNSLAKSGKGYAAAEKAEKILGLITHMEDHGFTRSCHGTHEDDVLGLDTRTMTLVLECWTQCVTDGDVIPAQKAQHILFEMEKLYSLGRNVKPNNITYTSCIMAWARTDTADAPEKAEDILNKLIRSYEESKDEDLRPTTMPFAACIHSYARSRRPDAFIRAQSLMERMEPYGNADTLTYNTLLDVCSKSNNRKTCIHASLNIWNRMDVCGIEKDSTTYNTFIDTITRDGEIEHIQLALKTLDDFIDKWLGGKSHIKPSILCFTDIINGYAKSTQSKKAQMAYKVFQRALDHSKLTGSDIKPDVRFFSAFINACANETGDSADKRIALKHALQAFELFSSLADQYGKPNHYTYSALLKACSRLTDNIPERCRLLEHVFIKCRDEKQVSQQVVYRIQRSFPKFLQMNLLKDCQIMNNTIVVPKEWYDNVPKRERP